MVVLLKKVKVVWYNDSGQEVQSLEENREGYVLYEVFVYIIDNLIGDVIVFDYKKKLGCGSGGQGWGLQVFLQGFCFGIFLIIMVVWGYD